MLSKLGKPGLFVRISHIIVVQILFVFVAVAIVLFYPKEPAEVDLDLRSAGELSRAVAEEVEKLIFLADRDIGHWFTDSAAADSLQNLFRSFANLEDAAVYQISEQGEAEQCYRFDRDEGIRFEQVPDDPIVQLIEPEIVAKLASGPSHEGIEQSVAARFILTYHPLVVPERTTSVLVTASPHRAIIGSRVEIKYGLAFLFLVSTVVSLLTVYLIYRRFQDPLKRLQLGLQRTTAGEKDHIIDVHGNEDLDRITESFNIMSTTLWENQKNLQESNRLLHDAYSRQMESRLFLATMVENSPCCVVAINSDGSILTFNRKSVETFGYDVDEAARLKVGELFLNKGEVDRLTGEGAADKGHEVVCVRKNGETFPAYLVTSPVSNSRGRVTSYLFSLLDISESRSFQEMMVRVDRYYTRGEMAGDIAHEINNYLAVLGGNVELMPLFMKRGDQEKITKKLELMKTTVDRIAKFTDGLMDVNADDAHFEQADINQIIHNMLAFLKPQNRFDDVEINTELSGDLSIAEVDIGQIQQLMVNLLNNAADAMAEQEGGGIVIRSSPVTVDGEERIRIEVIDDGPGVVEEKVSLLFSKRFTTKPRGHGYGLVTCRKIMDSHCGLIRYEFDRGARFVCEFPTRHTSEEAETAAEAAPASAPV